VANLTLRSVKGSLLSIQEMDDNLTNLNNDTIGTSQRLNTLTTASVTESGNLYFTNTRVVSALTGGTGISIAANGLLTGTAVISSTTNVPEGANLYFTNTRAIGAFTGGTGISVAANGLLTGTATISSTTNVPEGANLYFTNTRSVGALTSGSGISIAANGLVTSSAVGGVSSINGATGTVVLTTANIAQSGANLYYSNALAISGTAPAFRDIFNRANVNFEQAAVRYNFNIDSANTYIRTDLHGNLENNPTLFCTAGETISFSLPNSQSMFIRRSANGSSYSFGLIHVSYLDGQITNENAAQGQVGGVLYLKVPHTDGGNTIVYQSGDNPGLVGNIVILDPRLRDADLQLGNVTANSFVIPSNVTGTPTIRSETTLQLRANVDAGGAVVIQNAPFRVQSFTQAQVANIAAVTGDIVFNTSNVKFQGYNGTSWVDLS